MIDQNLSATSPVVLFVQRRLPHYRVPFFEALKKELDARGCHLRLLHGLPNAEELHKNDSGDLPWAESLPNRYFFGGKICWQSFASQSKGADLVICSHENKLIFNLLFQYFYTKTKFGLLGHGANLQGKSSSLRERFKRKAASKADWWFAYTSMSLPLIKGFGFPEDRITIANNSIDTHGLAHHFNRIDDIEPIRNRLGITGSKVGVYIGSFYSEKRIEFLLNSLLLIRNEISDFEMIIAGDGVERPLIEAFCAKHPWTRYVGLVKGAAKAEILATADVMLNPGLVGLSVLDSFVCAVPMFTTDCGLHSPEVVYLKNGVNGYISANTMADYVESVVYYIQNADKLAEMQKACIQSAAYFSVENMAKNFADGIMACLSMPLYRNGF
ncbi:MAG: glycosyltransferase family 4 protein [Proteobacteria bacterium]|nr:glycosyltransferase family 4 protein [Pseudomonadota bacterium]